jgi:DNA-binding NarL/FixJ family response regulator
LTQSEVPVLAAKRAVVADDFALARRGMVALLESLGIDVPAETHSARQLVALAAAEAVNLVIIGSVADGDAVETVTRCKQLPTAPTVVVLLRPRDQAKAAACLSAGADGVFSRRAPTDVLSNDIVRMLGGDRSVGQQLTRELAGAGKTLTETHTDSGDDAGLSAREREMLVFLAEGATNREIATALSLSLATVKSHLVHLYAKLGVKNRNEALGAAVARGLLS